MVRVSLATLLAIIAVAPAMAADMGGYTPPADPAPAFSGGGSTFNWQGAYAGVHAGYGWGSATNTNAGAKWTNDFGNPLGGLYGGYNMAVSPNLIVGAEADLTYNPMKGSTVVAGQTRTNRTSVNGSLRARVGVAYDRVMPYATAGVALANQKVRDATGSSDQTRVGYAIGAGIEGAITNNITARVEYLHQGYGGTNNALSGNTKADQSLNQVRAGVGVKF